MKSINWKITSICLVLVFFLSLNALADDDKYEPLLLVRGVRAMALGNAFEAIADDENAFYYNPAGLAQREDKLFYLLTVNPRFSFDLADESLEEVRDLYKKIDTLTGCDNPSPLEDSHPDCIEAREKVAERVEEALNEILSMRSDLPSIGLAVPFSIAENLRLTVGGSVYSQSLVSLRVEPRGLTWADPIMDMLDNDIVYNVSAQVGWEIASALAIPFDKPPIMSKAYIGIALRRINRWVFTDEDDPFAVEDIINPDGPDGIEGTDDDFKTKYFGVEEGEELNDFEDFVQFASDNFKERDGYSFDLGTLLEPMDGLKLAFVIRNLASSVKLKDEDEEDRKYPRNAVLSAAVKPFTLLGQQPSLLDLTLAASLDNGDGDDRMSDFSIDKGTDKIHLGAEAILFPNKGLSISGRIGNNQGFLTIGAGLKLRGLHLGIARYGDLETDWYVGSLKLSF